MDGDSAQSGADRIIKMPLENAIISNPDHKGRVLTQSDVKIGILFILHIQHLDNDRRIPIQVLNPLYEFCLVLIGCT